MDQTQFAGRPERVRWVKANQSKLRLLSRVILSLCAVVLLFVMLLLILPALKVRKVIVEGDPGIVTEEQIREASGVMGKEIVGLDLHGAISRIREQYPEVSVKQVSFTLHSVKIVVEPRAVMTMEYAGNWFSLDREFHVLAVSGDGQAFRGLLKVKLPAIRSVTVGERLCFVNEEIDRSYICDMLDLLSVPEMKGHVDLLDISEKFNVSFVLDGSKKIVLGKVSDLNVKLQLAAKIVEEKSGDSEFMIVNVSDPKKSTYRPLSGPEFLRVEPFPPFSDTGAGYFM